MFQLVHSWSFVVEPVATEAIIKQVDGPGGLGRVT